jgi:alanine dehydrogenase
VLEDIDRQFAGRVHTVYSTATSLDAAVREADLVIGAVLIPGASAPKLVTRAMLSDMKPGAVIVDVAIDQGGCFETSRPTTHQDPIYEVDGIVHYCVANMPGGVARTSTYALNNATLPHLLRIADLGVKAALERDPHLRAGLNVANGRITCQPVAEAQGLDWVDAETAVAELDGHLRAAE